MFNELTGENPDIAASDFFLKLGVELNSDGNPIVNLDPSRAAVRVSTAAPNSSLSVSDFAPTSVSFFREGGSSAGGQVPEPGSILLALTAMAAALRFGRRSQAPRR